MSLVVSDIPIIILAAGGATRMRGRDKLLENVGGQPLLRRQAVNARAATTGQVLVALPQRPHARYGVIEGLDVTPLPVPDAKAGMSVSLRDSFAALPAGTPAAMLMLADMPDLTKNDLRLVLQAVDIAGDTLIWRGATHSGQPGHPIVFAASLFGSIAGLSGDRGGQQIAAEAEGRIRLIPLPGTRARLDLDTPEDWANWRIARSDRT